MGDGATLEPQIVEAANSVLAVMDSSTKCSHCDPPFAGSSAIFRTYAVPGIKPARSAWVGTFGGAGHGNQEGTLTILRGLP